MEKIVNEICIHLENGLKPSFIRDLGYDYNLIRAIKARKNWNHISNNYNFKIKFNDYRKTYM